MHWLRISLFLCIQTSVLAVGCVVPVQQQPAYGPAPSGEYGAAPGAEPAQEGYGGPAQEGYGEPAQGHDAPPPPQSVSVTLRNSCDRTVRLFFGDKPRFGSGTYSSLSSNTVTYKSFRPGDMIWLVDDSDNGIAGASISPTTRTVEVHSSCTSLMAQ